MESPSINEGKKRLRKPKAHRIRDIANAQDGLDEGDDIGHSTTMTNSEKIAIDLSRENESCNILSEPPIEIIRSSNTMMTSSPPNSQDEHNFTQPQNIISNVSTPTLPPSHSSATSPSSLLSRSPSPHSPKSSFFESPPEEYSSLSHSILHPETLIYSSPPAPISLTPEFPVCSPTDPLISQDAPSPEKYMNSRSLPQDIVVESPKVSLLSKGFGPSSLSCRESSKFEGERRRFIEKGKTEGGGLSSSSLLSQSFHGDFAPSIGHSHPPGNDNEESDLTRVLQYMKSTSSRRSPSPPLPLSSSANQFLPNILHETKDKPKAPQPQASVSNRQLQFKAAPIPLPSPSLSSSTSSISSTPIASSSTSFSRVSVTGSNLASIPRNSHHPKGPPRLSRDGKEIYVNLETHEKTPLPTAAIQCCVCHTLIQPKPVLGLPMKFCYYFGIWCCQRCHSGELIPLFLSLDHFFLRKEALHSIPHYRKLGLHEALGV